LSAQSSAFSDCDCLRRLSLQPETVRVEPVSERIVGVHGEQRRRVFFRAPEIAVSVGALAAVNAI
jgi:hypothetical protein